MNIGASVWPNSCPSTGPSTPIACSSRAADIGAAPYQRHCSERQVGGRQRRVVEQRVDHRRRQERVGDLVPPISARNSPRSGCAMMTISPPSAMIGKQSTPAAWVSGANAR